MTAITIIGAKNFRDKMPDVLEEGRVIDIVFGEKNKLPITVYSEDDILIAEQRVQYCIWRPFYWTADKVRLGQVRKLKTCKIQI